MAHIGKALTLSNPVHIYCIYSYTQGIIYLTNNDSTNHCAIKVNILKA